MDILDIVDINDNVIGTATREECHTNPKLLHHTVHFTLYDPVANSVLFSQRSYKKSHDAGLYCFMGEHILTGESYMDALKRGASEELGLEVIKAKEFAHNIFSYNKQTELVRFFIGQWDGQDFRIDPEELESVFWVRSHKLQTIDLALSEMARYWIDNVNWRDVEASFS